MQSTYQRLFQPIRIGTMELKNRIVLAPMGTCLGNRDDSLSERMIGFYTRIARGGTGLVTTGVAAVSRDGTVGPGMNSLYHDRFTGGFQVLADSVHEAGAKLSVHLMHAGLEAFPFFTRNKHLVSPSGGIFGPNKMRFNGMDLDRTSIPSTSMTRDDIRQVGDDFAEAALRAKLAGADAVELNGAQGFLLQQFYSPHFNTREDEYGGCFANRMRFPLEVVAKVRNRVGADFPLIFRMVCSEGPGGSLGVEDAVEIARVLEKAGVDALHVTAGRGVSPAVWTLMMPIAEDGHTPIIDQVARVTRAVDIPVIGVQRIVDPDEARDVLEQGKADMVALGRGLIADPDWVEKTAQGRAGEIRKCIGCLQGCIGTQMMAGFANCLQNPEAGREEQMGIHPADTTRKVLVVGAGPAGLEAALVCGMRGHEVVLCEKEETLGGQWNLASVPPGKQDYKWVVDWRVDQLLRMSNVTIERGCEVNPDLIGLMAPDVAIIATGSTPVVPDVPGADSSRVVTAHDVLGRDVEVGERIVIIGGGATGCETANYLAAQGKSVTLVEAMPDMGAGEEPARKIWLMKSLSGHGVQMHTRCGLERIDVDGDVWVRCDGEVKSMGGFDTIVMAVGTRSRDELSDRLGDVVPRVYVVGDAYAMPTNGLDALHHASEIARSV